MNRLQTANAFVVQFRTSADGSTTTLSGRLEHVNSGSTAFFQSVDDLPAILRRMIAEIHQEAHVRLPSEQ
jgi:hypothetical protein